jgi:hypothetical protein
MASEVVACCTVTEKVSAFCDLEVILAAPFFLFFLFVESFCHRGHHRREFLFDFFFVFIGE